MWPHETFDGHNNEPDKCGDWTFMDIADLLDRDDLIDGMQESMELIQAHWCESEWADDD